MLNVIIIFIALSLAIYLAFSKKLSKSSNWKGMLVPLASIMGSGFLISAPLLGGIVGNLALIFMILLLILAFMVGGAIRFNIKFFEPIEHEKGIAQNIASVSRFVLIGAYFISITYYLELLAAFLLNILAIDNTIAANVVTSILLIIIGLTGIIKGLDKLEAIEKYAISLNLGIIGALIFSLILYNIQLMFKGTWALPDISSSVEFSDIRVILGLLIVVQGFETSRYLGKEYPAKQRIATMRNAQFVSSAIYIVFIAATTILFNDHMGADVTAIISIVKPVAIVLPLLLTITAIGSQFSAAVSDYSGAGGLIEEITNNKLPFKYAYLVILLVTLFIVWETNVNQIIAYASRAFALYYSLQCIVAFFIAKKQNNLQRRNLYMINFLVLSLICLLVFFFGIPSG